MRSMTDEGYGSASALADRSPWRTMSGAAVQTVRCSGLIHVGDHGSKHPRSRHRPSARLSSARAHSGSFHPRGTTKRRFDPWSATSPNSPSLAWTKSPTSRHFGGQSSGSARRQRKLANQKVSTERRRSDPFNNEARPGGAAHHSSGTSFVMGLGVSTLNVRNGSLADGAGQIRDRLHRQHPLHVVFGFRHAQVTASPGCKVSAPFEPHLKSLHRPLAIVGAVGSSARV
jgi:hypothetical protein